MIAMWVMQMPVHQIIDMVTVRDGFVSAARTVLVAAFDLRRAAGRIRGIDRDHMLVDMIAVHVVQMTIVQIVEMALVADCGMAAIRTMLVGMVRVMLFRASGHDKPPLFRDVVTHCLSAAWSIALCIKRRT
jgi:hypothetical protein